MQAAGAELALGRMHMFGHASCPLPAVAAVNDCHQQTGVPGDRDMINSGSCQAIASSQTAAGLAELLTEHP